jgi:threonine dehydratase
VIAGQGTIGLELLEQLPDLDTALVPLSGGGLISGIALALKSASPGIRVLGVSMARAPVMYHSLKAGKPIQMDEQDTLADSLRGGIGLNNQYTFPMVQELVDDVILVSEDEIAAAMSFAFYEHHLVLEGAGAVGIAALLSQRVKNTKGNIAVILSGGNVAIDSFLELIHPH